MDTNFPSSLAQQNEEKSKSTWSILSLLSPRTYVLWLWRTFRRLTIVTIFSISIIWVSTFVYLSLYYLYIPSVLHQKLINFQFDSKCFEKCLHPHAELALTDYSSPSLFTRGQGYSFTVDLHLPESEINWEQGMFMIKIDLYDAQRKLITSDARSAILRYKSSLVRTISILAYWPWLVFGFKHEEQYLQVPIIDNYVDGITQGTGNAVYAVIYVEARQIQVYSSTLIIEANLRGLRYFMVNWPLTSAILGTTSIMVFVALIAMCSIYRVISSIEDEEEDVISTDDFDLTGEIETYRPDSTTEN